MSRVSRSVGPSGSLAPPEHVRVLHVDDDPALLDLAAEFLERLDGRTTVRSETDPLAVPDRVAGEPVDCVVSDVRMPRCDGFELCRRLREEHPDLPVVLFTSERGEDVIDRATAAGATDYVPKSPGVEQYKLLATRIREAVESRRRRGESEPKTPSGTESSA